MNDTANPERDRTNRLLAEAREAMMKMKDGAAATDAALPLPNTIEDRLKAFRDRIMGVPVETPLPDPILPFPAPTRPDSVLMLTETESISFIIVGDSLAMSLPKNTEVLAFDLKHAKLFVEALQEMVVKLEEEAAKFNNHPLSSEEQAILSDMISELYAELRKSVELFVPDIYSDKPSDTRRWIERRKTNGAWEDFKAYLHP